MKSSLRTLALAAGLLAAAAAGASPVYSSRAAWAAATASSGSATFNGIVSDNTYQYMGTAISNGGLGFAASQGMFVIGGSYAEGGGAFCFGSGGCLFGYSDGITINTGGITSIGLDLRGYYQAATTFDITLSNGEAYSLDVGNPQGAFWGVTSSSAFEWLRVDPRGEYIALDNVAYGSANTVSEPGALSLAALALAGAALSRRRSRRKA